MNLFNSKSAVTFNEILWMKYSNSMFAAVNERLGDGLGVLCKLLANQKPKKIQYGVYEHWL